MTLSGLTAKGRAYSRVTTTDDRGAYSFDQLPPGSYSVYRTLPEGFLDSKHGLGTVNGTALGEVSPNNFSRIVLQDGSTGLDYNFAEVQAAALRGVVWVANEELDEEGNMLSVVGKSGVTVLLTGKDDRGSVVRRVVKSDAEGHYAFEGIYPGEYAVQVMTPSGFRAVEAQAGNKGGTVQEKKQIDRIRLKAGDRGTEYEFYQEGTGQINGRVGTTDVEVVLTGTDREGRTVERKTTTDAKGNYLFSALPPGKYRVAMKADPGKETGTKSPALANGKPAGVPATDAIAVEEITLGADGRATGPDFTPSGGDE